MDTDPVHDPHSNLFGAANHSSNIKLMVMAVSTEMLRALG